MNVFAVMVSSLSCYTSLHCVMYQHVHYTCLHVTIIYIYITDLHAHVHVNTFLLQYLQYMQSGCLSVECVFDYERLLSSATNDSGCWLMIFTAIGLLNCRNFVLFLGWKQWNIDEVLNAPLTIQ